MYPSCFTVYVSSLSLLSINNSPSSPSSYISFPIIFPICSSLAHNLATLCNMSIFISLLDCFSINSKILLIKLFHLLMNILGLLDIPDSGNYILDGTNVSKASENQLARIRNNKIGFIFQNFNLLSKMTAVENIQIPLIYQGKTNEESKKIALELINKVGLSGRENHLPTQLSGGQQQRVAIARALACNPEIILADEPTRSFRFKNKY